jgi:vacuolar-type H+-ATPase subunit D/Vma8
MVNAIEKNIMPRSKNKIREIVAYRDNLRF